MAQFLLFYAMLIKILYVIINHILPYFNTFGHILTFYSLFSNAKLPLLLQEVFGNIGKKSLFAISIPVLAPPALQQRAFFYYFRLRNQSLSPAVHCKHIPVLKKKAAPKELRILHLCKINFNQIFYHFGLPFARLYPSGIILLSHFG